MPPFTYSQLKAFETCARQYHELKVLRNYRQEKTEQVLYGERLHLAAEEFIVMGYPLPREFEFLREILEGLKNIPGEKYGERKLAITEAMLPCDWDSKNAWFRGITDISIVNEDKRIGFIADYKSGSAKYPDPDQLDLMALLLFAHHPNVVRVRSALLFVTKDVTIPRVILRGEIPSILDHYKMRNVQRVTAHNTGVFNPKKSGLCKKHCPVSTCEFYGG